jgi:hypothetical protein
MALGRWAVGRWAVGRRQKAEEQKRQWAAGSGRKTSHMPTSVLMDENFREAHRGVYDTCF